MSKAVNHKPRIDRGELGGGNHQSTEGQEKLEKLSGSIEMNENFAIVQFTCRRIVSKDIRLVAALADVRVVVSLS